MRTKPRQLILDLLLAADGGPLSARDAVIACSLYGISENSTRVALARLVADDLLEIEERAQYRLSPKAHELADDVAAWRSVEQRIRPWSGGYIVVHSGALGRSDRARLRARQRALDMLGFRELERGLHIRPDNVERNLDAVRKRLLVLGLEREASVFQAGGFDAAGEARIRRLWNCTVLNKRYRQLRQELEDWMRHCDTLEPRRAAREAFLVGGQAIRQIVYDPLLPEPFVDAAARHEFIETVRRFDLLGRSIWRRLYVSTSGTTGPWRDDDAEAPRVAA